MGFYPVQIKMPVDHANPQAFFLVQETTKNAPYAVLQPAPGHLPVSDAPRRAG
jgi:hypothetical protein